MKKATSKYFVFISFIFLFISCAPVYIPNAVNTPMFREQHDASLQGSAGLNGYDVQTAYSPIKHLGIMGNISFYESNNYSYNFYEGGAGYYNTFEEFGCYEVYGGFGNGKSTLYKNIFADTITGQYNRIFLQPSIGIKNNVIEASFATRFSYVDMYHLKFDYANNTPGTALFIEPAFSMKVGYKFAKFFMQFGYSFHSENILNVYSNPLMFNIGLNLNFSKLYLSSEKKD